MYFTLFELSLFNPSFFCIYRYNKIKPMTSALWWMISLSSSQDINWFFVYIGLEPQNKKYQFKLYDKHKVCGKWTQAINRINKKSKPIKITITVENKRQR